MSVEPVLCQCKLLHRWIALAFPLRVSGGAVSLAAMLVTMLKRKTEKKNGSVSARSICDFVSCAGSGMQPQPGARQLPLPA